MTGRGHSWTGQLVAPTIVFVLTLAIYFRTVAPSISWRNGGIDSGELVTAIYTLGIPHPTGFPVYVLLGKLFTFLPFGEVAYRVNVMSAFLAALTAALLTTCGARLIEQILPLAELAEQDIPNVSVPDRTSASDVPDRIARGPTGRVAYVAAAGGALAFGLSPLFWSRATIAKEYSLHLCLLSLGLLCLLEWRSTRYSRWLIGLGITVGFGLGNHVTSLSIVPGAAAFLAMTDARVLRRWRAVGGAIAAILPGVASYVYLPLRAAQNPYLNWDNPTTFAGFLTHLSGAAYHGSLAVGLQPPNLVERLLFAVRILPEQIGWLGLVALFVGLWVVSQVDRPFFVLGASLAALNLVFAAVYPVRDSEVYLLPVYLVGALVAGVGYYYVFALVPNDVGAAAVSATAGKARERPAPNDVPPGSVLDFAKRARPILMALALVTVASVWSFARGFAVVDANADLQARRYAEAVLAATPANAIVLTNRDDATFSLWYVQQVLGTRQDVVVVDGRLLGWEWYRASLEKWYPDLPRGVGDKEWPDALLQGRLTSRVVVTARPPGDSNAPPPGPAVVRGNQLLADPGE